MSVYLLIWTGATIGLWDPKKGILYMLTAARPGEFSTISTHHFAAHV
jgi:hypothetical protein